jgi:hypothetical protein
MLHMATYDHMATDYRAVHERAARHRVAARLKEALNA